MAGRRRGAALHQESAVRAVAEFVTNRAGVRFLALAHNPQGRGSLGEAATAILVLGMSTAPAHACSCLATDDWGFLGPSEGRLPANAVGVAWYSPSAHYEPEKYPVEALERALHRGDLGKKEGSAVCNPG